VNRSRRIQRALPAAVLGFFTLLDLLSGPGQVVLGLVVIAPLVAATALGKRATLGYAVGAFVVAALLGIYDQQYTAETMVAQSIRLFGVALAGVLALGACSLRVHREAQLATLSAQAAATSAALQTAEALQLSLLGDSPRVAGLETAVRYLPATRYAQVGGDWYDAFLLPDGRAMLVIGDVTGHDAPAAATMAQVRGMLRAIAQSTGGSPAAVLSCLDEVLASLEFHTLVTVAVATIDLRGAGEGTALLCWSSAGHLPPVFVRADGRVQLLERTPERVLGVDPSVVRTDHELTLRPGDTLLLYTDGLVERRNAPLDDGLDRLVEELQVLGREPLDQLCDELLADLDDLDGGRVDDDVALLAIRVPAAQPARR
jgi:sigma-B regulation protein RsbU (phosphoserine phosphatase)